MLDSSWLWIVFTVIAAAAQTVRNATQRELTAKLGTVGATHVRFLFGFPFAFVFLAAVMIALGQEPPRPPLVFWPWVIVGALAQVAATALMLAAMNDRSFVVVYAYIKTEPVQVALFGLVFLGDMVTPGMAAAILIATAASVRTLALVEVLFAQAISRFVFKQATTAREAVGIVLIVVGVVLLLWAH